MAKNEKDKQREKGKLSVSRRDFLVTGGAMIAGGALSASSIAVAAQKSGSPGSGSGKPVIGGGSERAAKAATKYGKYVTREIIGESKYPQITAPIAKYDGCRGGGNALTCEWSCITRPFVMDDEPEIDNERDQFMLFYPGDIENPNEFTAEVELSIGEKGKKQIITTPTYVWIPKGTRHGLVNFKTVRKPICFMSYYLAPEYSTSWVAPDESMYVADLTKPRPPMHEENPEKTKPKRAHYLETNIRYMENTNATRGINYYLFSSTFGWPAKVSPATFTIYYREYFFMEPVHAHRQTHQVMMHIGSNPLNIEDFDARIEIWMGKERELHIIDTCAVDHVLPGLVHQGDEVRIVNKPVIRFQWDIGPYMNNYFAGAAKDKVLLSDESKGEVMILPDAPDYVPPTKIEDYVWNPPEKKK